MSMGGQSNEGRTVDGRWHDVAGAEPIGWQRSSLRLLQHRPAAGRWSATCHADARARCRDQTGDDP